MVVVKVRWPKANLIHPNFFNYVRQMNACNLVPEIPSHLEDCGNPNGTQMVHEAVVITNLCDLLPHEPAGVIVDLAKNDYSVSWEKSNDGLWWNITLKSNDEEE